MLFWKGGRNLLSQLFGTLKSSLIDTNIEEHWWVLVPWPQLYNQDTNQWSNPKIQLEQDESDLGRGQPAALSILKLYFSFKVKFKTLTPLWILLEKG